MSLLFNMLSRFVSDGKESFCPLIPSLSAYPLTWVSLTLDAGVSLHSCSSKAQLLLLTSDAGMLYALVFLIVIALVIF